jgi:hypothetical protein
MYQMFQPPWDPLILVLFAREYILDVAPTGLPFRSKARGWGGKGVSSVWL